MKYAFGTLLLVALPVLTNATARTAEGQQEDSNIILGAMEQLPEEFLSQALPNDRMIYVIIRTPGKADLILLPKQGLTPPALVAAFADLAESRTREPAPDRAVVGIGTQGGQKASTTVGGDGAAPVEYASLVQQIRAAPLRPLRNLGAAQWIEVAASEFGL